MTALVIAEHNNRQLHGATLNTITAALVCDNDVHVLVAGDGCRAVATQVAAITGVSRVLLAEAPHLADSLPENLAAQIMSLSSDYSCIAGAATAMGKSTLPRVAALLDVSQISEITAVLAFDTFERPFYAGNAVMTVRSTDRVRVLTVRMTSFEPAPAGDHTTEIVVVPVVGAAMHVRFISRELTQSNRPDLAAAGIVVSGGRGLGSADNYRRVLEPLADKLGAALGASRAAVDAGYASNDSQVGQTGKVVAPRLYFAVGISGAIQHLAGMKDSGVIVAINKDPEAPIFQIADYGLVGDLFEVVPDTVQLL